MRKKPQSREKWVIVPYPKGFKTKTCDYYFSNFGNMKSVNKVTDKETALVGSRDQYGNILMNLKFKDGKRCSFFLHLLIAGEFVKNNNPETKTMVIRKDGNKENNYFKNLKWVDQEELTRRQIESGKFHDNRKSNVKLTPSKVRLIKKRLLSGRTKPNIIARNFNISLAHLQRIEKGQHWGHID